MVDVVVITGCSSGIGHATAIEFATKGYQVIAGARRLEPMKDLEKHGVRIIQLDVTSQASVEKLRQLIIDEYDGKVKYLFNNAGQACSFAALDLTDEVIRQCYEVNLFAPMRMVRELGPFLIEGQGTVGFTGSVSGIAPFPFASVYSSTKAAIHSYANTLAFELEPLGVKVINIITGGVSTAIAETRPFPADSIYMTDGMAEVTERRKQLSVKNMPYTAETYAKQVVQDFENLRAGVVNYYRGSKVGLMRLSQYFPRFVVIYMFIQRYLLTNLWENLKQKYHK